MHERLLEAWLDSASERSYQSPFCQLLAAQGHRLLHSTRHVPIEFGKDILTVAPDGVPCAFQLKGNPGGRLTLTAYRQIESQLHQLVNLPIVWPSLRKDRHRSYLVTNGLVEEEVVRAIDDFNQGQRAQGYPHRQLMVLARGDLLRDFGMMGLSLWPTELEDANRLLELMVNEGTGPMPLDRFHHLLAAVLNLDEHIAAKLGADELRRRITSAAVLTSVALRRFSKAENHYAVVTAWTIYTCYVIAACGRNGVSFERNARTSALIALGAIKQALRSLVEEVLRHRSLSPGDPLSDVAVYRARYTLLLSLLSIYWFWCVRDASWQSEEEQQRVEGFLLSARRPLYCWGEGAIPQILCYYWFLNSRGGAGGEDLLVGLLATALRTRGRRESKGLAGPYFDFENVMRHELGVILGTRDDPLRREDTGSNTFAALPLMHLLVRTNRKNTCRDLWPDLTRFNHLAFYPRLAWRYCLIDSPKGRYHHQQLALTKSWTDLVADARRIGCPEVPLALRTHPILMALFLVVAPHRILPSVVRTLAWQLDSSWHIAPPLRANAFYAKSPWIVRRRRP